MSTHLLEVLDENVIPQSESYREDQVTNSAGGYSWKVDEWKHLRRFLVLGTSGGTYYISQRDSTKEGLKTIEKCLSENGRKTVDTIVNISEQGIAAKNDYALFALAVVVAKGDTETKRYALSNLNKVVRIGTHLFQFAEFLNKLGSLSGRAKRRAFANWYAEKDAASVAYQVVKYRNRNGWTHRDILRVAHPGTSVSSGNPSVSLSDDHKALFSWISGRKTDGVWPNDLKIVAGFEAAQKATTKSDLIKIIEEYNLPREAIPTEYLTSPEVWEALLNVGMPINALIRNLANMTKVGLLTSVSDSTQVVLDRLSNVEALRKARIHPINVLFALSTYASGRGFRGSNAWTPVQTIVDALDSAFYKTFENVEPTGKRILLALDISSSMTWGNIGGTNITPAEGSSAMALVTANVESRYEIVGFSTQLKRLNISPKQRLDQVVKYTQSVGFGGTDCAAPMNWANKKNLEFDAFVVYTDSETWAGGNHPVAALKKYRKDSGINDAKLVVVGMIANQFSIADPTDPGMLDVVGFDTTAPQLISDFITGRF